MELKCLFCINHTVKIATCLTCPWGGGNEDHQLILKNNNKTKKRKERKKDPE